jgi:hypothetical protein
MKIYMFAMLDKAKPDTGNTRTRGLNLAVVRSMNIQMIKLVLQSELLLIVLNVLYRALD